MYKKRVLYLILIFLVYTNYSYSISTEENCTISLKDSILTVENGIIKRTYKWNNGNVITKTIENKNSSQVWISSSKEPDLTIPGFSNLIPKNTQFQIHEIQETLTIPYHKYVEISFTLGTLDVKRIIRLYSNSPAIKSEYFFKGKAQISWTWNDSHLKLDDFKTLENLTNKAPLKNIVSMENLEFSGKHWKLKLVELLDNTDTYNSLVNENEYLSYKKRLYKGNILFMENLEEKEGLFMIKEAPSPMSQLNYPGGDYIIEFGHVKMIGTGLSDELINSDYWQQGYSSVVGITSKGDLYSNYLTSLKYLRSQAKYTSDRADMVMMNTWGDRSQDGKINEQFILRELEEAKKLGISHFQIDDGWQQGLSEGTVKKSAEKKWDKWDAEDWMPHKERFPNGLTKIIRVAKEKKIELGLWFNPTKINDYASWETDADIVIGLFNKYGIKYFKIDGVQIDTKLAENNFLKFLNKIKEKTNDEVFFNLDVTAGRRFGYLYKTGYYGNVFVENRYTDWKNYYPYWTLRNLWMLSKYVPAQNLQIEFLNNWRNDNVYPKGDIFSPSNYSFDYLFAITMMGQPLAWFEASNLPKSAYVISDVIKLYKQHQERIHSGIVLPIGNTPSGTGWTGFQSIINPKEGYLLLFRENNNIDEIDIDANFRKNDNIKLTRILGDGQDRTVSIKEDLKIPVYLKNKNSYALYYYRIIEN